MKWMQLSAGMVLSIIRFVDVFMLLRVDGFGSALCMDDANVPSLLAAPYLGYCSFKDAIYQNTRKMIWSGNNPYFFKGKAGEGVGGPHVGLNYIWPMSIIMKAFTTDDSEEIRACLKQLRDTDGGTGFMHESFQFGGCRGLYSFLVCLDKYFVR